MTAPFPRYVARRLGMEPALAAQLLGVMRHLATCGPPARVLPARLRRPAIVGLVRPLLADPPPRLAYLLAQPAATPCGGLLPPS